MSELKRGVQFSWAFKLVDSTDLSTPKTGVTLSTIDCYISKDGGAMTELTNSATPSYLELGHGWYRVIVTAAEMTADVVVLVSTATGCYGMDEKIYPPTKIVGDLADVSAAEVQAECESALADYNAVATGDLPANFGELSITADGAGRVSVGAFAPGAIDVNAISDDAITAGKLKNGAITYDKIADNAIGADKIEDGALLAEKFAVNCITPAKIQDGAITAAKLDADCITAAKIDDDALSAEHFNTGALTSDALAASFAEKIADILIRRSYASVRASSDGDTVSHRSLLGAIAKLVNKLDASSGSSLIVYHEDDLTPFETSTLTASGIANPITVVNPSGGS